jgi:N-acetylglucosamine-6-phosphate deacetylase
MLIKNCRIIYLDRIEKGDVLIRDGKIAQVGEAIEWEDEVLDGQGLYLSPGFIDIHIHGAKGSDVMDGTFEALNNISKAIAKHGTTAFLPTTMTYDTVKLREALSALKEGQTKGTEGAQVLGVHMEGPFINRDMIGAQNPEFVQEASIENFIKITEGFLDEVKVITLAPEVDGAGELIKYIVSKGIVVSIGHTDANYVEVVEGIKNGVTHSTHLFNAMKGFHHREPGTVGAIFDNDITTEIICDGVHLSYPIVRTVLKQKSTDKVMLISDAMRACGMNAGQYELGGQKVILQGEEARLQNGALAGSVLTLDKAIKNVWDNTAYPLYEIVKMVTYNAAKHCGVQERKGLIQVGYDADLVLFDDELNIKRVFINGDLFEV